MKPAWATQQKSGKKRKKERKKKEGREGRKRAKYSTQHRNVTDV